MVGIAGYLHRTFIVGTWGLAFYVGAVLVNSIYKNHGRGHGLSEENIAKIAYGKKYKLSPDEVEKVWIEKGFNETFQVKGQEKKIEQTKSD